MAAGTCLCASALCAIPGGLPTGGAAPASLDHLRILPRRGACRPGPYNLGKDRSSTLDAVADLDFQLCRRGKDYVCAGAEFDHPDTLATGKLVACFFIENDAPGQQTGYLLEDQRHSLTFHGHDVLLIRLGGAC